MSARETADAMKRGVTRGDPSARTVLMPIADGGEGTVDALGAEKTVLTVTGPDGGPVSSFFGRMPDGSCVIEMAAAAGLPQSLLHDPERTTTYGVGQLIAAALDAGCRTFTVGIGGSATNDAGCGMAAALGAVFTDDGGSRFVPTGGTLSKIARIDVSGLDPRVSESSFRVMCDVTNPLYGENGAAYVFAPQKGADADAVVRLDEGLRHFADCAERDLGRDVSAMPGGGAAGGMGAACVLFLGASLQSGIDTVLELAGFDSLLQDDAVVLTGEGKFDRTSLGGKAVSGVASRAAAAGVPVIVLAGSADVVPEAYGRGVTAVFSIQRRPLPFAEAMARNVSDMEAAAEDAARLVAALRGRDHE